MIELELLSPARDLDTGIAAIDCGADAVYIGASHHGARRSAGNSIEDIRKLCEYAKQYRVKIYVTLNTIIFDNEIEDVRRLVFNLYEAGVDALIVQDMSLLQMDLPPIPLHASTQCDIRTPQKARFLQDVGFSQLVLPREMTLDEIREVRTMTSVPLEAFVHGALCVSYSGDCRASYVIGGRSANRGDCAQICRLPYNLVDNKGNIFLKNKHLLSLKDLNRLKELTELIDAGITSFKIEGRLKSIEYVRNVTAAYSEALNDFIKSQPRGKYCRSSIGISEPGFMPDVNRSFNRGFTPFYLRHPREKLIKVSSIDAPGHIGTPIAKVIKSSSTHIEVKWMNESAVNGDGFGYFDRKKCFRGFRANRVENNKIYVNSPFDNPPQTGTIIFRNFDKQFNDRLVSARSRRYIEADALLTLDGNNLSLSLSDDYGIYITESVVIDIQRARSTQKMAREQIIRKTGDTIYRLREVKDLVSNDIFIPASRLTQFRREAINALYHCERATVPVVLRPIARREDEKTAIYPEKVGDMHLNVANNLSQQFYKNHGTKVVEPAIEKQDIEGDKEVHVMTTRHCVRRELGACLLDKNARKISEPLVLSGVSKPAIRLRLEFDCNNCQMKIYTRRGERNLPN